MAAIDPYAPCPCGSGEKFKWCCQKVEAVVDRADRLFQNGQSEAAIEAINEGLLKEPGNALLLLRKAYFEIRQEQLGEAAASLRTLLARNPTHVSAHALLVRLVVETEGPLAAIGALQQALTAVPADAHSQLATDAYLVGTTLAELGSPASGLAHLRLSTQLTGKPTDDDRTTRVIEKNPAVPLWLRSPYRLAPPAPALSGSARERFEQALRWADQGLWSSAAAAFEMLSTNQAASLEADRNLGICRLWMADDAGAVEALRRAISRLGTSVEAVDLEALCQEIAPLHPDDTVEQVQLIWPLRDRERLLANLRSDPRIEADEPGPIDPGDPESPEVDRFDLLDRPIVDKTAGLRLEELPRFVGSVLVGQEIAALEAFDDGRLDGLVERFTQLAAGAIPPAHPKTKVIGRADRAALAVSSTWRIPPDTDEREIERLRSEQQGVLHQELWPQTPQPYLKRRTPLQAAKAGDAIVPLRAALMRLEQGPASTDCGPLRTLLGIEPEPPIDPATVDIDALHIARLASVPADRLDDSRLVSLYRRARDFQIADVLERSGRLVVGRPQLWQGGAIASVSVFSDLAMNALQRGKSAEAHDWARRGREADPAPKRAAFGPHWDLLEVRIRAASEPPEAWVPELAVVLNRYEADQSAAQALVINLIDMGLMQMVPNPEKPQEVFLDSRPLQMLLAKYGPRVTTASGQLGVSATKGGIWTPGGPSSGGGGGGLWTPGSNPAPAAGGEAKPKLIVPGR